MRPYLGLSCARLATALSLLLAASTSARAEPAMITAGDWHIAVECAGPRTAGTTVWLEHGTGARASASTWDHVFLALTADLHVCRLDRPGAGKSLKSTLYGPDIYIERIEAVLRSVHAEPRLVIVGHSFGGYPARVLAQAWPGRVSEVILVDAISETLGLRAATGAPDWPDVPTGAETIDAQAFEAAMTPRLAMPVTVISRGRDSTGRWNLAQIHLLSLSNDSRQILARRSGHMIPLQEPDLLAEAIREAVFRNGP